jgi:immune inhibitor A
MARFAPLRVIAALLAVVVVAPGTPGHSASSAVALPSPQALDTMLTSLQRPPRNLYALTARLKLHTTTPVDPYVNHAATDYPVGSVTRFYIGNGNRNGYTLQPATLVLKTAHAYFYVQQGVQPDLKALQRSADTFEHHSYPTDHTLFGKEWTPGVDNDAHITIFNGQVPDVAGYFSGEDLFPRVVNAYSNQRKMIYMNLGAVQPGTNGYDSVLAHEFQHMIHFNLHPADEAWINEGSSVLAEELNGYGDSGFAAAKAAAPGSQLDAWDPVNYSPYYGGGYTWMLYLYEHYGGARFTQAELADRNYSNMALFDDVLAKLGYHQRADDVFADWVIANYLNDRSIYGGRYGYTHTSEKSRVATTASLPFSNHATLPQYSASYTSIATGGSSPVTLHFTGQPTVSLLSTVAPTTGFWWSNRGDSVDTTLTTPLLDLRAVSHATLHYQLWYELEQDYDYGYVEVSTDGGKTWFTQRAAHTTNGNPNGANIGNGYTGSSCSAASKPQHCWVNEQLDLSPYAGKKVLVRFEQVTDDEYNRQGIAIAHVQVPQIGFDGDTAPDRWQSAGWVRSGNTLAEHWIVQAMIFHTNAPTTVVRMPVDAAGHGSLTVPAGSSRVVVAVSPAAPLTTVGNSYTLSGGS